MKRVIYEFDVMKNIAQTYYRDHGYCGVVAVSAACQVSMGKSFHELRRLGRRTRHGTYPHQSHAAMQKFGVTLEQILPTAKTVGAAIKRCDPSKTYIIHLRSHILCVDAGKAIDWATENRRHKVVGMFEVTRNFTPIKRAA